MALPCEQEKIDPKHCILHFFPNKAGKVIDISGFEEANKLNNIEANAFIEVGATLPEASCDGDRMGYVISYHEDSQQAEQQLTQAIDLIHFEVKS